MDYLFVDVYTDDKLWRGLKCRACGSLPSHPCISSKGSIVRSHAVRRHDLIQGRPCTCGRCKKGPKPSRKRLDSRPQN